MKTFGIDIGYGHVKIVSDAGRETFRSIVGPYEGKLSAAGLHSSLDIVETPEGKYLVGDSAIRHSSRTITMRDRDWIDSLAWLVLLTRALKGVDAGEKLVIVTGLPVSHYRKDQMRVLSLVKSVAGAITNDVTVKVIPQPLGAIFSVALDVHGKPDPKLADLKIAALDIGHYTTDLLTLSGMEPIQRETDTIESGIASAFDLIASDIHDSTGWRPDVVAVEAAAKCGVIRIAGEQNSVVAIVDRRFRELAAEITAKAKSVWKSGADLDLVIVAGGGAEALKKHINLYKQAVVPKNAGFAVAEGYFRLGRRFAS